MWQYIHLLVIATFNVINKAKESLWDAGVLRGACLRQCPGKKKKEISLKHNTHILMLLSYVSDFVIYLLRLWLQLISLDAKFFVCVSVPEFSP